ncbi:MAG: hypothetical protein IT308_08620 [Anaerolineaceae bacterium]|nr:hypothetical protein [Anaerolineaceae bacterium]
MAGQPTNWALTLIYWLHLAATVVWLGGLTSMLFFILPAAEQYLGDSLTWSFLKKIDTRMQQVGWFCLVILVGTGLFQMSSHPSYEGFLTIGTPWSFAILSKHLVIGLLILASGYTTWNLDPKITRLRFLQKDEEDKPKSLELKRLEALKIKALWISLGLILVILGLTAWARTS